MKKAKKSDLVWGWGDQAAMGGCSSLEQGWGQEHFEISNLQLKISGSGMSWRVSNLSTEPTNGDLAQCPEVRHYQKPLKTVARLGSAEV